ncbi:MAG: putative DNA binding domain-containing protein [Firmicutes bacterium]|nr:putative DNA binding domain-containing protein [Bacillota bacterium]
MDSVELKALVEKVCKLKCETRAIEVKAAAKGTPEKLYNTLSSFSNQDDGGVILFGIDENKGFELVGVYDPQDLTHRVSEQCKQMTPHVRANITTIDIDGKSVVAAEIPSVEFVDRPVFYMGAGRIKGSFVRVGESDEPMTEYEVYLIDAYKRRIQEDIRIIDNSNLSDLDDDKVALLLIKAKADRPQFAKLDNAEILERLGIAKDGKPTLTGLLTVGKYPQGHIPQFSITATVVPGYSIGETGSDGERFIANKRFCGTIDEMLNEAVIFVGRNMRVKTIIENGKRKDKEEYPLNSVREVILNALMHRDISFRAEGIPIQITLFYDRMEVSSPGGLFGRLTAETLGKGRPDTRNSCLASILEILGTAENRFSGIPTIRREFEEANLPDPIFKNSRGDLVVTFFNGESNVAISGKPVIAVEPTHGNGEERLLEYCKTPRTRGEIAKFFENTQYYVVKTYIAPLIEKGKLALTLPNTPKSKKQRYITRG